ncbi:Nucleoporin nup35 [Sarracenia purpurea var. burkii]
MSTTMQRTPNSRRQSLFFQDLASPVSTRRGGGGGGGGKFTTPGQAAAVLTLWRDNFAASDLPPPPAFTLEDRSDFSPDSGIPDFPLSPEIKSPPKTPARSSGLEFSSPKGKSEASTSYAVRGGQQQNQQSPVDSLSWWSSGKSGEQEDEGKSSPVEGVVQPGALIILPPPREVARLEMQGTSLPVGNLDEEEWVTVYGPFSSVGVFGRNMRVIKDEMVFVRSSFGVSCGF